MSVVLIDASLSHIDRAFTYGVPEPLTPEVGSVVRVPFHGKRRTGVVVALMTQSDTQRALPVHAMLGPGLGEEIVSLARWMASRYLSTLGEALAAVTPARTKAVESESQRTYGVPEPLPSGHFAALRGGAALMRALQSARGKSQGFVLRPRSDTGRAQEIAALATTVLATGGGVLVLVPEVRVGGDVMAALAAACGPAVAHLASDRPARERYRDWLALRAGTKRIAIGGRAAVFAPIQNLRLIVIDDESHTSYKEARAPRFHARAVAAERARSTGATLVLIGVPPSIEARTAVDTAGFTLVAPSRADERAARPPVTVVRRTEGGSRLVPDARTLAAARRALDAGGRVLVLTHRGATAAAIAERAIRILRPRAPARLDARSDPAALRDALKSADLICATPYVAKDLTLDGLGLLALLEVDAALAQPQFRATEEAFATWWRAARWVGARGHIVIETADPSAPGVVALARWDPDVLWRAESSRRTQLGYPPFAALARIDVPTARAQAVAAEIAVAAPDVEVLGPTERFTVTGAAASVILVRDRRREKLLDALAPLAARWRAADEPMRIDVDPWEVLVPKWQS